MSKARAGLAVVMAACLVTAGGCRRPTIQKAGGQPGPGGPDPAAVQFYDALAALQRQLDDSYQALGTVLSGMTSGRFADKPLTPAEVRKTKEQFGKAVADAQKALQAVTVPNLEGAQELYQAQKQAIYAESVALEAAEKVMKSMEDLFTRPGTVDPVEMQTSIETLGRIRKDAQEGLKKA